MGPSMSGDARAAAKPLGEEAWVAAPAPAKLNLCLQVTGRRADGYHLLDSVFQLIDLHDVLELRVRADDAIVLHTPIPGVAAETDLTVRAARALQAAGATRLGADIRLKKTIPMGAGLGGGSSDAATVLAVLNRLWKLDWETDALQRLSVSLGADVPFFLFGRNARVRGIGEILEAIDLARWYYVLVAPPVAVATRDVFGAAELTRNSKPIRIIGSQEDWFNSSRNDLEPVVLGRYPEVRAARHALREAAREVGIRPESVRMTGSGSCVFCPSPQASQAESLARLVRLREVGTVHVCRGLDRHPLGSRQVG